MLIRPGDLVDTGSTARVVREMVDTFITEVSQDLDFLPVGSGRGLCRADQWWDRLRG